MTKMIVDFVLIEMMMCTKMIGLAADPMMTIGLSTMTFFNYNSLQLLNF